MNRKVGTIVIAAGILGPLGAQAQEALISVNAGWVSEYYYRGIPQKASSASAGLDVEIGSVYLGTWAAEVGDGSEVDLYGGVGFDIGGLSLSAGGTGYFYTGEFDNSYLEGNLGAGVGPVTLEFSIGTYDSEPSQDYWFLGATAEHEGVYATFGTFGSDFSGNYGEAGYGFTAGDMDFSISGILSDSDLSFAVDGDGEPTPELTLVFGVSKTFDLN